MGIDNPTLTINSHPLLTRLGREPMRSHAPAKPVPESVPAAPSEQTPQQELDQQIQKFIQDIHRINQLSVTKLQNPEDLQQLCTWMYHAMSLHADIDDFIRAQKNNVLLTKTIQEQIHRSLATQYKRALLLLRFCVEGPDTEVRKKVIDILDDPEKDSLKPQQFLALFNNKREGEISNASALRALRNFFYAGQTHVLGAGVYETSNPRPKYPILTDLNNLPD